MKTTKLLSAKTLFFALLVAAAATGCKKDDTTTAATADDAADATTYALASSTDGLAAQTTDAATYADNQGYNKTSSTQTLTCGVVFDTTFNFSANSNSITASYTHNWSYLLNCAQGAPQSLTFSGDYNGNYSGPRVTSTNTGTRNWTITGLDNNSATPYTFNGSFTRTGSTTMHVRNQNTYNVNIQITATNITVSKTTYRITGGSGSADITCTASNGNQYSFTGAIVFNGNSTATLTIDGNTYTVTLY